jgi:hypothetical protein
MRRTAQIVEFRRAARGAGAPAPCRVPGYAGVRWIDLAAGRVAPPFAAELRRHLRRCHACGDRFAELLLAAEEREAPAPAPRPPAVTRTATLSLVSSRR